jgi:hypothetical protein
MFALKSSDLIRLGWIVRIDGRRSRHSRRIIRRFLDWWNRGLGWRHGIGIGEVGTGHNATSDADHRFWVAQT